MKCPRCSCNMRRWNTTYNVNPGADRRKRVRVKVTWSCLHCKIYLTGDASGSLTMALEDDLVARFDGACDALFKEKPQCNRHFRLVVGGRQTYVEEVE